MNTILLLQIATIILVCIALSGVSSRIGIPTFLAIILLGMLLGNHGVVSIGYIGFDLAQRSCEVALIFITFYGGFAARWDSVKPVLREASLLSSVGVILTAALTGVFCHFALRWNWYESLLLGAIVSSTDSASVFSILKSRKLSLKNNISPLIEMESGSNDPMAHMLTLAMISVMRRATTPGHAVLTILDEIFIGAGMGILIAKAAGMAMRRLRFKSEGFNSLFVFALAILSFALPNALGGNGYLSTYIVGILVGRERFAGKKSLVHFFDGVTLLMETFLFFILGALARPAYLTRAILPALGIFVVLQFIARPLAVHGILLPFRKYRYKERSILSFAGLRGAASIVFAVIAINKAAPSNDLFSIVFCLVFFSMFLQGLPLPALARRRDLIDKEHDVLRNFNDFSDDEIHLDRVEITPDSNWMGKTIGEVVLPEGLIIALVIRDGETLIPKPDLKLEAGDLAVVLAKAFAGDGVNLKEKTVKISSRRVGHPISDYPGKSVVIMIMRDEERIIPAPSTILQAGDQLVILDLEENQD